VARFSRIFIACAPIYSTSGDKPGPAGSPFMFDILWLALTIALFGVSLAYLAACERM
jgi:hypothetical protein